MVADGLKILFSGGVITALGTPNAVGSAILTK